MMNCDGDESMMFKGQEEVKTMDHRALLPTKKVIS